MRGSRRDGSVRVGVGVGCCAGQQVHGEALLRIVRTCYNVFLGSKSEVNQTTAKASLTQMLTIVFHRMEADKCGRTDPLPALPASLTAPRPSAPAPALRLRAPACASEGLYSAFRSPWCLDPWSVDGPPPPPPFAPPRA